ncbi:MAG: hypothetical protein MI700_00215, partial [Balneolales bacterium]|nr:hypothetical protein [Balneolales bacterium]
AGIDLLSIFQSIESGNIRLRIEIDFGDGGYFNCFLGYPEYNFDEIEKTSNASALFNFDVDFVTGWTLAQDTPISSEVGQDIISLMPQFSTDFVFVYQALYTIFSEICGWPDQVIYACSNIEAENWRYYTYPKGTTGIPDPNVIFREMKMPVHNNTSAWNDNTLGEMLQDFAEMFFCSLGYSTLFQKPMVHHYFQGQRDQTYAFVEIEGLLQTITFSGTSAPITLDSSKFSNTKTKKNISFQPIQAVSIQRSGVEALPEHPTSSYAKNHLLDSPHYNDQIKREFIAGNFYLNWLVQDQPDPSISDIFPGRLFDRDFFGITSGLNDLTNLQVGYWSNLLFRLRSGLDITITEWLDPMLPQEIDGEIHRLISGRRHPINITTEFQSIVIGPEDNFS